MTGRGDGENQTLIYGQKEIDYKLFLTDRKTIEIAVHPDNTVIVKAPKDAELSLVEKKVLKRGRWIFRQIDYFRQFTPRTTERRYVNGETHLYLGKQYRIKIGWGNESKVKLSRAYFIVTCKEEPTPEKVRALMGKWYLQKARVHFNESFDRCWPRLRLRETAKPKVLIRRMKCRWGSLSAQGNLTLNTELVKAPKECIDYVVIHELCHLKYHSHSCQFYQLLSSLLPEWEKIKHKLEVKMA